MFHTAIYTGHHKAAVNAEQSWKFCLRNGE